MKTKISENYSSNSNLNNNSQEIRDNLIQTREVMIGWNELTFNIKIRSLFKSHSFKILDNINGYFESNTLNAIMSPSGKTTLLKCLNGLSEELNI
jgi:ABC-type multidrug transport system ATPase subunit